MRLLFKNQKYSRQLHDGVILVAKNHAVRRWEIFPGLISPAAKQRGVKKMQVMKIRFRVPAGEEFSDDRMDELKVLGVPEEDVSSGDDCEIEVQLRFEDEADEQEIEAAIEEFAEAISDVMGDMDLIDFDYLEED